MRTSRDLVPSRSATPIYDRLYAEYRRLFRALPGDRSGEEGLRFEGFGFNRGVTPAGPEHGLPRHDGRWPAALPPAPWDHHR